MPALNSQATYPLQNGFNEQASRVPIGANLQPIKNLDNFLTDRKEWENVAGMPIIVVDNDFANKMYGTNEAPRQEMRELAETYRQDPQNAQAAQELAASFKENVQAVYGDEYNTMVSAMSEEQLATAAMQAHTLHGWISGHPDGGSAASGQNLHLNGVQRGGAVIAIGDENSFTPDAVMPGLTEHAGELPLDNFSPGAFRATMLVQTLERVRQEDIEQELGPNDPNRSVVQQLDAERASMELLSPHIPQEELQMVTAATAAANFHDILGATAQSGTIPGDLIKFDTETHHANLDANAPELPDVSYTYMNSLQLSKMVLNKMGLSESQNPEFSGQAWEQRVPTYGELKTALAEIVSDPAVQNDPDLINKASLTLDKLDTLGVTAEPLDGLKSAWEPANTAAAKQELTQELADGYASLLQEGLDAPELAQETRGIAEIAAHKGISREDIEASLENSEELSMPVEEAMQIWDQATETQPSEPAISSLQESRPAMGAGM